MNRLRRKQLSLAAELNRNARRLAERSEHNPRIHAYRAALAESELTGESAPIDDFVRRFKMNEALRFERFKRAEGRASPARVKS